MVAISFRTIFAGSLRGGARRDNLEPFASRIQQLLDNDVARAH